MIERCKATSFWLGPLGKKLICGLMPDHAGIHVAFFPGISVGFTDDREYGTVVLARPQGASVGASVGAASTLGRCGGAGGGPASLIR